MTAARRPRPAAPARPAPDRVADIRARLEAWYGRPVVRPHGRPLDELVLTVLSQSTNDRNRDVAFARLREAFPDWRAVRDAPVERVEEAIRPGGISRVKSARIQAILRALPDPPSLDELRDLAVAEGRARLCALPGVGRKTAACVLLFAFNARDVPVDTHVGRVATRLGLLRPGAGSEEQHDAMTALTPPGAEWELHVNLLRHGRRLCRPRNPRCPECPLLPVCPTGAGAVGRAPA